MASPFDSAFEASAAPLFDEWFTATVQLKRGANTSEEFTATWYSQEYETIEHETGLAIAVKRRVYVLLKTLCVVSSVQVTPRPGDEIIDGSDTLKILPMGGKPAVEEIAGGYRWLVRTDKLA